jgi:hypothetical protein
MTTSAATAAGPGTPKQSLRSPVSPTVLRVELKLAREETARYESQVQELTNETAALKHELQELKHATHEEIKQRNATMNQEQRKYDLELRELRDKFTVAKVELEEQRRNHLKRKGESVKVSAQAVEVSVNGIKKTLETSIQEFHDDSVNIRQQFRSILVHGVDGAVSKLKTIAASLELSLEQLPVPQGLEETPKVECQIGEAICFETENDESEPTRPSSSSQCNINAPVVVPCRLARRVQDVKKCLRQ